MSNLYFFDDHLIFRFLLDILTTLFWILISTIFVELTRFVYHALHHECSFLYNRMHRWHHETYKISFANKDELACRRGFWFYDLPEASSMVFIGFILFYAVLSSENSSHHQIIGVTFGIFYSLREVVLVILKFIGINWAIKADINHAGDSLFYVKPNQLKVNLSYHWRHHFHDERAYLSGVYPFFDYLWGTAISLRSRRIACLGDIGSLSDPLQAILSRFESMLDFEPNLNDDLSKIDVLMVSLLFTERDLEGLVEITNSFLGSFKSIHDVALKEIWILFPGTELTSGFKEFNKMKRIKFSNAVTSIRLNAPCIVRKIFIDKALLNSDPNKVIKEMIASIQRDSRNFSPGQPIISFWCKLKELSNILFYQLRKR